MPQIVVSGLVGKKKWARKRIKKWGQKRRKLTLSYRDNFFYYILE